MHIQSFHILCHWWSYARKIKLFIYPFGPSVTGQRMDRQNLGKLVESYCDIAFQNDETAFWIVHLPVIEEKLQEWKSLYPRVTPFYAVKCNSDKEIIRRFASLGSSFDCASKAEIELVREFGVNPSKIIVANPVKEQAIINSAKHHNIHLMTFDSTEELSKVAKSYKEAQLVLRISTEDSSSLHPHSNKYGCCIGESAELFTKAKELGLDVVGVSFHVGSRAKQIHPFLDAIKRARKVFDIASNLGFHLKLLVGSHTFLQQRTSVEDFLSTCMTKLRQQNSLQQ